MIAFKRAFEAAALATAALAITAHAAPADEEVGDAPQILVSSRSTRPPFVLTSTGMSAASTMKFAPHWPTR